MSRIAAFLWLAVLGLPAAAPGQVDTAGGRGGGAAWHRPVAHYGKWATAAAAVALTWMGAREHARSADWWDRLLELCGQNHATCTLGPDGRYLDATAEHYYQTSLWYDRRARLRLLAGQGALLVTVGLFLLDRRHGADGPENIPFPSLGIVAEPERGGARVGLRWTF
ncbi:MAG TPA: hypothetical protein VNI61_01540 [Gemmatimonadales bacterium]|nr:hypothetical protein [Gemmatimonadales bacterium]